MSLRFVIQPLFAAFLGICAGLKQARSGRPTWFLLSQPLKAVLSRVLKDISRVLLMAIAMDVVYQLIVLHWIYPLELVFTAGLLAIVPYILARFLTNGIARVLPSLKRVKQS